MRKTLSDDRSKRARERRRIGFIVKRTERDFCESGKSRFLSRKSYIRIGRRLDVLSDWFIVVGDGALDVPKNQSDFYFTSDLFHRKRSPFPKGEGKSG